MSIKRKIALLDKVAVYHSSTGKKGFTYGWKGMYELYKKYRFTSIKKFLHGKSVLEIGPAEGDMTNRLLGHFDKVGVLEGSGKFSEKLSKRFGNRVKAYEDLVENFQCQDKFDVIIMSHILEHLRRPPSVLRRVRGWLNKNGRLIIIVPNSNSLHRHIGVRMGMLRRVDDLNKRDADIGHRRVYNPVRLRKAVEAAGLTVRHSGGILIKPFSNKQMVKICSKKMLTSLFELGSDFPEIACEIFVVCVKKGRS